MAQRVSVFGLAILLIALPMVAAFLKEKPESMGSCQMGLQGPMRQRWSQRTKSA
jgi:hypothetical protein